MEKDGIFCTLNNKISIFTAVLQGVTAIQTQKTARCKFKLLGPILDIGKFFAVLSPVAPVLTEHAEWFLSTFWFRSRWFGGLCVDMEGSCRWGEEVETGDITANLPKLPFFTIFIPSTTNHIQILPTKCKQNTTNIIYRPPHM